LDCVPAQESGLREGDRVFLDAPPGSDDYLPFPFPSTDAQRIADLTYEIEHWQRKRARGSVGESSLQRWATQTLGDVFDSGFSVAADLGEKVGAHLLRGVLFYLPPIREGKVRFTFESVEDWTHVRCVYSRARTWTVARVFDIATGTEISRVALDETGFFRSGRNVPSGSQLADWPDAARAAPRLAAVADRALEPPILVRSSPYCNDELLPCVAAESADSSAVFVLRPSGEVFRVSLHARVVFPRRDFLDVESTQIAKRYLKPGEFLFWLGPDVLGVGEPLATPSP